MKHLIILFFIGSFYYVNSQNIASNCSGTVQQFQSHVAIEDYTNALQLCWSKAPKDVVTDVLKTVHKEYGVRSYSLLTDSIYEKSSTEPKEYVMLTLRSYYTNAVLVERYMVVNENNQSKIASYKYEPFSGAFNDELLITGSIQVAHLFLKHIYDGNINDAYALGSTDFAESVSKEDFTTMTNQITEKIPEITEVICIDTCSILNMREPGNSFTQVVFKLNTAHESYLYKAQIGYNNLNFTIANFNIISEFEINNQKEIDQAKKIIADFYLSYNKKNLEMLYGLLHPGTQALKSKENVADLLKYGTEIFGNSKKHKIISSCFVTSKSKTTNTEYMLLVENENEKVSTHDTFLLQYDENNQLKITYFYLLEF